MPAKDPTLNLIDFRKTPRVYHNPKDGYFQIESMKNTIKFQADSYLTDEEVDRLIDIGWNVNIRAPRESDYK
jgi:hypothetical protein